MAKRNALASAAAASAPATVPADPAAPDTEEPLMVAFECNENRTVIGKAIVAAGRIDFPITQAQGQDLEKLGKGRIVGIWTD